MHEFGLGAAVVDAVERRADGRPVDQVTVRVGVLQRVEPEALAQAFALAAEGGVAQDARVEVVVVPARVRCPSCGLDDPCSDVEPACPRCGAAGVEVSGGDELMLESLRYRAEEA